MKKNKRLLFCIIISIFCLSACQIDKQQEKQSNTNQQTKTVEETTQWQWKYYFDQKPETDEGAGIMSVELSEQFRKIYDDGDDWVGKAGNIECKLEKDKEDYYLVISGLKQKYFMYLSSQNVGEDKDKQYSEDAIYTYFWGIKDNKIDKTLNVYVTLVDSSHIKLEPISWESNSEKEDETTKTLNKVFKRKEIILTLIPDSGVEETTYPADKDYYFHQYPQSTGGVPASGLSLQSRYALDKMYTEKKTYTGKSKGVEAVLKPEGDDYILTFSGCLYRFNFEVGMQLKGLKYKDNSVGLYSPDNDETDVEFHNHGYVQLKKDSIYIYDISLDAESLDDGHGLTEKELKKLLGKVYDIKEIELKEQK